ncbi:nuclear transport factor 2 family protein [Pelagibacterium sp. H642]|uniref:nuclear transport factor 2 family protein n=1 Tax=Pelagibacterium sp. H642 TaxID=1881069 RepID=UPI002815777E|nr:nuclear transport factor 2 family protein [Pelagibacterium sp. H642]WMT92673.1 nuclear transport factor 2 family protein [Pelagibacterium sp. H642]
MTHNLPQPIARYFAAGSPQEITDCFADGAEVFDEGRRHHGRDEILRWREEVSKISFDQEILSVRGEGETFVIKCQVSGSFPGSPIELDHIFVLSGDKIGSLGIE